MKINKIRTALICLILSALLAAAPAFAVSFTDAMGRAVEVESPRRVVSLYGSYGDVWLTAGGTLAGAAAKTPAAASSARWYWSPSSPYSGTRWIR